MTLLEALENYINQDINTAKCISVIAEWMADESANYDQLTTIERDHMQSEYYQNLDNMKLKARSFNRLIKERK